MTETPRQHLQHLQIAVDQADLEAGPYEFHHGRDDYALLRRPEWVLDEEPWGFWVKDEDSYVFLAHWDEETWPAQRNTAACLLWGIGLWLTTQATEA